METIETLAELKQRKGTNKAAVFLSGGTANADNLAGAYVWDAVSTATADDFNTVQVTGVANGRWLRQRDRHSALTYAGITDLDFNANPIRTISLTGNIALTTSNRGEGKTMAVRIIADASGRTFTFPAGWEFVGEKPTGIDAGKVAMLTLLCFGSADTDILAGYAVKQ